jgi:hypothetical protein
MNEQHHAKNPKLPKKIDLALVAMVLGIMRVVGTSLSIPALIVATSVKKLFAGYSLILPPLTLSLLGIPGFVCLG